MDRYPISASSLEKFYYVDGHLLERQYREHLGGYFGWEALPHADEWLVFPENVGPNMSIDETALSDGELYTVLTNKDARGGRGGRWTTSPVTDATWSGRSRWTSRTL